MNELIRKTRELRHTLHRHPERSHEERATAGRILDWLKQTRPDELHNGIGGHGLAAVYRGAEPGPRVLIRSDMDALPIDEHIDLPYKSEVPGTAHKCGHDGHMAMLSALATRVGERRPARGEAVLLYQPAEETGEGAAKMIEHDTFASIRPDHAFALHNLPGFERGTVILREGPFASASTGLKVLLHGATSHAAEPERGASPALAVASLIQAFSALPQFHTSLGEAAKVTIIHARVGEVAFGTSPGEGAVMATLRAHTTETLERLQARCEELARSFAAIHDLKLELEWVEPFPGTNNDPEMTQLVRDCATKLGYPLIETELPFPWSEDFGNFSLLCPSAMFGIGAGKDHPALHHPDYDFPDEILENGISMFDCILRKLLG